MEKHIFKFGENSLAIIVPKKWTDKNGLKPSSPIFLSESESGNLIISPMQTRKTSSDRSVDQKASVVSLTRWIGLHYMYGTARLHIHSKDGFTNPQSEAIEEKINAECPGFEITSQSSNDIFIEDLTDIKEIDLKKIISRIHSLINQEFKEASEGNPGTIPKVERLINRFFMLGMRYVNITQAKDALVYSTLLEQMESLSDKFNLLATNTNIKGIGVFEEMKKIFDSCIVAFEGDERAIENVIGGRDRMIRQIKRLKLSSIYKYLLMEMLDNISNIAELGFKKQS